MANNKTDDWSLPWVYHPSEQTNYNVLASKTFLFSSSWSANLCFVSSDERGGEQQNKWKITKTRKRAGKLKWWTRSQRGKRLDVNVFIIRKWKVDTLNVASEFSTIKHTQSTRATRWCLCNMTTRLAANRAVSGRRRTREAEGKQQLRQK